MNKKLFWRKQYHYTFIFIILFIVSFSATFLIVKSCRNQHKNTEISCKFRDQSNNIILQTPNETHEWRDKLKDDVNKLKTYSTDEKISTKFTYHKNNIHGVSHELKLNISGQIGWHAGGRFSGSVSGTTYLDSIKVTLNPSSKGPIVKEIRTDDESYGRQWGWSGYSTHRDWNHTITISIPSGYAKDDFVNSLKIQAKMHYAGDNENNWVRVKNATVYNGSKQIATKDLWSLGDWGTNSSTATYSSEHSINFSKVYIGETDYKEARSFTNQKIYMTSEDLNTKSFNQSQLQKLIKLKYGKDSINDSYIHYKSVTLDKAHKLLRVSVSKIDTSNSKNYYSGADFTIPIHVVNLNNMFQPSTLSSSFWEHLPSGETRYHSTLPHTVMTLSEDYIKSLYISKNKNKLLKKISKDNWGFIASDKTTAINKIKSYELNISNYEKIKQSYITSHDANIINSLSLKPNIKKIINTFGDTDIEDYLYILKNSQLYFKKSVDSKKGNAEIQHTSKGIWNDIDIVPSPSQISKADSNRTNWTMHVWDWYLKTNSINGITNSIQKMYIPDVVFKNFDVEISPENSFGFIHKYLYQTHGLDISNNISFVTEDGSVLDQDFKVISKSSESSLNVGDYAYIAIRYWATLANKKEEYVTLEKKGSDWYSPKYSQSITTLDPKFDVKRIEYLFNQNIQMLINPYRKQKGASITSVTPQSFGLKTVEDKTPERTKILENWNDGKWSHAHDVNGIAKFDGMFGSDVNGIFDSTGRLIDGRHNIKINLQNSVFKGLKNDFFISIDKEPVKASVRAINGSISELEMLDDNNDIHKLYWSNGPINFKVNDIDIKSIDRIVIHYISMVVLSIIR